MEIKFTVLSIDENIVKNFYSTLDTQSIFDSWVEENNLNVDTLIILGAECEDFNVSCLMAYAEDVEVFVRIIDDLYNYTTAKELFNELSETDSLECGSWYEFDEEFFKVFFSDPYESARATYFGEVRWRDEFIRINSSGNLETTNEIDYEAEGDEILECWLNEKY